MIFIEINSNELTRERERDRERERACTHVRVSERVIVKHYEQACRFNYKNC